MAVMVIEMLDADYKEILQRALIESDEFSLVWRHEFEYKNSADSIRKKLSEFLISEALTSSWPGTDLIGAVATVRKYRVSIESIAILHSVNSVYAWIAPKYPEDLAFYKNGKVIFWSIAHENEAGFELR